MAITASAVKELREMTGAGMMDCKKALAENDGDLQKAAEYLKIKGIAKADKKADRVAAEGLVGTWVSEDRKTGAMIEVNCETDFVARNEAFEGFVSELVAHVAATGITDIDALLASDLGGRPVEEVRKERVAGTGENITLRRAALLKAEGDGFVGEYVHMGGAIGVLVQFGAEGSVPGASAEELGRDVAMHAAAMAPHFTRESEIDENVVENEKRVLTEQAMEEGKPAEIVEKMVIGRIRKWRKEICLVDQPFVKNPDVTIQGEIDRVAKEAGARITLEGFTRFARGEGIEKKESNLAEEVAATLK
ncbi:MAG: elongation factor Ts [Deltaproteobacteria bacterium]|nr:MAG: elongation factor Ts [Deltaproteobacteria bacterium]